MWELVIFLFAYVIPVVWSCIILYRTFKKYEFDKQAMKMACAMHSWDVLMPITNIFFLIFLLNSNFVDENKFRDRFEASIREN